MKIGVMLLNSSIFDPLTIYDRSCSGGRWASEWFIWILF